MDALIAAIITGITNGISYLISLKASGSLTDAQLETLTTGLNTATRQIIDAADPALAPPPTPAD